MITSSNPREENRKNLLDYVEKRITFETDSRKSSETRAIAIVTLNIAITTMYFALRSQIGLWQTPVDGLPKCLLIAATLIGFASIVSAVVAVMPARVPVIPPNDLDAIRQDINDGPPAASLVDSVLESRLAELRGIDSISSHKARATFVAIILFFVAATVLVAAIIFSAT